MDIIFTLEYASVSALPQLILHFLIAFSVIQAANSAIILRVLYAKVDIFSF